MKMIKLYTRDDCFVADAWIAPFSPMPEVVFWGLRCFVRMGGNEGTNYSDT